MKIKIWSLSYRFQFILDYMLCITRYVSLIYGNIVPI